MNALLNSLSAIIRVYIVKDFFHLDFSHCHLFSRRFAFSRAFMLNIQMKNNCECKNEKMFGH